MAWSEYYVVPDTGNDYKGTTFTDGAFTVADMTLTKVGAFTASKVNHWLYLTDNGSGEVTAGYYRIASVTSANAVVLATSPKSGANDPTDVKCIQHSGTTLLPWRSVQGALDLVTRNATDGDRINLKAGTADTIYAALSIATYGTSGAVAPLIIQGYTTTAGDGGIGEITAGGANISIYTAAGIATHFIDLKLGDCGTATVLTQGPYSWVINCELHHSSAAVGVTISTTGGRALRCYFHDLTGATGVSAGYVINCFLDNIGTGQSLDLGTSSMALNNIVRITGADTSVIGITVSDDASSIVAGNTVYCSNANTSQGIFIQGYNNACFNNIVEGFSGAGGDGIEQYSAGYGIMSGGNAVYNCTSAYTGFAGANFHWEFAANDTLLASPFTDAANGDFSIPASTINVTEDAYPDAFKGLATTTNKQEKGAVQSGAGGGTVRHPRGLWMMAR